MTVEELLEDLRQRDIELALDSGDLVVRGARGQLTEELRAELSRRKPQLVDLLQRQAEAAEPATITPDPANKHAPFPLSDMQEAYWIGRTDAAGQGGVGCHYYQEFESTGLDLDRLERAFQTLIARHDILRAIVQEDGQQRILPETPPFRFGRSDMRGCDGDAVAAEIERVRAAMSHEVFDPATWPLFRIHAVQQDGGRLRLHLSFDLLILDGGSLTQLIKDWQRVYEAGSDQDVPIGPSSDISFRDYMLAEKRAQRSHAHQRAVAYWENRLNSLPMAPSVPRRPATQPVADSKRRVRRRAHIPGDHWQPVKRQARERGLTASGVVCAAYAEILGQWSRAEHFSMNLTYFSRERFHEDVDKLLGDFTSNVMLEVDHQPARFGERALALQRQLQRDLDHARVSGIDVLRRLNRRQESGPLVTNPFVFTSLIGQGGQEGAQILFTRNWLGEAKHGITQTPQTLIDFQACEEGDGLLIQWDALEAEFPDGLLDAMFDALQRLFARLGEEPDAWDAAHMDLLPADQRARRQRVNATDGPVPDAHLHTLFERQAAARPDAEAVIADDRRITYGDLDRASLALAHDLQGRGVRPNQHVAVVMQRGWEQVAAVLGVLRAGGAYMPVAADVPPARLHEVLREGEAALALTQPALVDHLDWPSGVTPIPVTPDLLAAEPGPPIPPPQNLTDLAYTIFTSGSTGKPKGVMIDHRAAANTVLDINRRFEVGPQDRVLALSALNFDLSVYDIFGLLAAGGAVAMLSPETDRDPRRWIERLNSDRITIWNSVPQLMRMLVESHDGDRDPLLTDLRLVMMSGDWIPPHLPLHIPNAAPNATCISLGGATEAAIWSIFYHIDHVDPNWASIPYGIPLTNQRWHVFNHRLEPCPDWVYGDLFIAGIGLAQGYWRNQAETVFRFVEHPVTGERVYRTGDIGRYLPDGNIELLGRDDSQVKIGGHRIELGEIEAVLKQHAEVHDATVIARPDQQGEKQLVGYVVPAQSAADADLGETCRAHLAASLPAYMVPPHILAIEALPLTDNGKLDRKRLPEPAWETPAEQPERVAPGDDLERQLVETVQNVLGVDDVGVNDNVLQLGGSSVQMVQINRRLRQALGCEFSVAEMFNHPTLRSLAQHLHSLQQGDGSHAQQRSHAGHGARGARQRQQAGGRAQRRRRARG